MGRFCQILTELYARDMPKFSFPDDNLSKCQGILTKLCTCIGIKEIWFGIANGQISPKFFFLDDNLNKCQGFLTKFGTCIDIWDC